MNYLIRVYRMPFGIILWSNHVTNIHVPCLRYILMREPIDQRLQRALKVRYYTMDNLRNKRITFYSLNIVFGIILWTNHVANIPGIRYTLKLKFCSKI
jgi:hypothetical protein